MRNIELLTKIRDLIERDPGKLDMGSFSKISENELGRHLGYGEVIEIDCGTTQCIAGWAVWLCGYRFRASVGDLDVDSRDCYAFECIDSVGRFRSIDASARELLGITWNDAEFLFYEVGNNDAVDVLNDFIAGKSRVEIRAAHALRLA